MKKLLLSLAALAFKYGMSGMTLSNVNSYSIMPYTCYTFAKAGNFAAHSSKPFLVSHHLTYRQKCEIIIVRFCKCEFSAVCRS